MELEFSRSGDLGDSSFLFRVKMNRQLFGCIRYKKSLMAKLYIKYRNLIGKRLINSLP